jgi:hypothetical protein
MYFKKNDPYQTKVLHKLADNYISKYNLGRDNLENYTLELMIMLHNSGQEESPLQDRILPVLDS